jgi:cobalt-zinc-cadmium efflux system outer membrane protein
MKTPALTWGSALAAFLLASTALAQTSPTPFNWQQIKEKFAAGNPTLKAARSSVNEAKASEITAYLRPNPSFTASLDQLDPFTPNPYQPLASAFPSTSLSYLHERGHKRELRRDSAQQATAIAESAYADQERNLLFTLRNAFVQTLQAKAVLKNAQDNLEYWDKELAIFRLRLDAGDLAQVDLNRLLLQRVQFESDYETAVVNLRTNKIQLLQLLNERTPLDQFSISGPYDFADHIDPQEQFRQAALGARPDLKEAAQSVDLATTNHKLAIANGTADPTFSVDVARNPPIPAYFGVSVSIPLRIFDKNQGEKERTRLDIERNQRLRDATEAQVFSDVDSAYAVLLQNMSLLRAYKSKYLELAVDVRDRLQFSYQDGGASLLDYLDAEKGLRDVKLAYLNLIGSYLTAAAQMNLSVGKEIIP